MVRGSRNELELDLAVSNFRCEIQEKTNIPLNDFVVG